MDSGVCSVCGEKGSLTSCVLCEKKVCQKCLIPLKGICRACKDGGDTDLGGRSLDGKY
jgi:hypothetical protein